MSLNKKEMRKKRSPASLVFPLIIIFTAVFLLYKYPDKRGASFRAAGDFLVDFITVMPGIMILMGLFSVWIKKETIIKYLGRASGARGILLLWLGMIPTGPLYVAFPLAVHYLNKGRKSLRIFITFSFCLGCITFPRNY